MRLLTLCSGIGSPEQAALNHYENIKHVAMCELDKFARKSLLANYDIDPKHLHEDVTTMDGTPYCGEADILVGGFPCQAFSIAGKRNGFKDDRGNIFFDVVRITKEVQPDVFIFENVKGLVGHDKGKKQKVNFTTKNLFGEEIEGYKVILPLKYHSKVNKVEIGRTLSIMEDYINEHLPNYSWSWKVLNSKDYGIPQNRERVFMVGFKDKEAFNRFRWPLPIPLTLKLSDMLEDDEVDEKYYLKDKNLTKFKWLKQGKSDIKTVAHSGTGGQKGAIVEPKQIIVKGKLEGKHDQNNRVYGTDGIAPSLTTMQGGGQEPKIVAMRGRNPKNPSSRIAGEPTEQRLEVNSQGISNCLTCVQKDNLVLQQRPRGNNTDGLSIRKLTPRECLNLQGFPQSFKIVVSDTQAYKQAGNSITVDVMEALYQSIDNALNGIDNIELGGLFKGVS